MNYFVATQTGLYGPADIALLSQWAGEGRLDPNSVLEEEGSGRRLTAGSVPGITFTTFQQAPNRSNVVSPLPASHTTGPMQPLPPKIVSNYRRPDYQPPLFLANEVDGRKELRYSFIFAVAAPIVAMVHLYGVAMAIGGIYCGVLAFQRGRKLGIVGTFLNVVAIPLAIFLRFVFWGSF